MLYVHVEKYSEVRMRTVESLIDEKQDEDEVQEPPRIAVKPHYPIHDAREDDHVQQTQRNVVDQVLRMSFSCKRHDRKKLLS